MATVVNHGGSSKYKAMGQALGEAFTMIAQQRADKKKAEVRKTAFKEAIDIFGQGMEKGTMTQNIPQQERQNQALTLGGGPTKQAAVLDKTLPRQREVPVRGLDVASILIDADVDEKFAMTLASALDEGKATRMRTERQSAAMQAALSVASQEGASRQDLIASISGSQLDTDSKLDLLKNLDKLLGKDPEAEKDFNLDLYDQKGMKISVPVPVSISKSNQARKAYVDANFPGYSADPIAEPTKPGEDLLLFEAKRDALLEVGTPRERAVKLAAAGNDAYSMRGPDSEGRVAILDKTTGKTTFVGGGELTQSSLRIMEQRIFALEDAIFLLERTDPTGAGIVKTLGGEVGGVAVQIPVLKSMASVLGLGEEEVANLQVERGKFFNVLQPLAQSFVSGGSRAGVSTKQQRDLAERMLNMTRMASTPQGAELAKRELMEILKHTKAMLVIQRQTKSIVRPEHTEVRWEFNPETGKLEYKTQGGKK